MNFTYHLGRLMIRCASEIICSLLIPATVLVPIPFMFDFGPIWVLLLFGALTVGDVILWHRFHGLLVAGDVDLSLRDVMARVVLHLAKITLVHLFCVSCTILTFFTAREALGPLWLLGPVVILPALVMLVVWWVLCEQCRHDSNTLQALTPDAPGGVNNTQAPATPNQHPSRACRRLQPENRTE